MRVVFRTLYDEKMAAFLPLNKMEARYSIGVKSLPKIVFPSEFQPELGESYDCHISETRTGTFVYNGIRYHLCYAGLKDTASIIDVVDHNMQTLVDKKPPQTLGDILKKELARQEKKAKSLRGEK
jgi:hypothetical protein